MRDVGKEAEEERGSRHRGAPGEHRLTQALPRGLPKRHPSPAQNPGMQACFYPHLQPRLSLRTTEQGEQLRWC